MNKKILFTPFILSGALLVGAAGGGCEPSAPPPPPQNKMTQAALAQQAAESIQFNDNAEINNIKRRIELTSKPGQIGYIVLLNAAGQPILYESVVGKVTSGTKRLTPPDRTQQISTYGQNGGQHSVVRQAPSDEGTFGSSSEYIFYWNADGTYRQWSGSYLYSDQPIRLRVEPLVINIK